MATFKLTIAQAAAVSKELVKAEIGRDHGTLFGQLLTDRHGAVVCRCFHVDQDRSLEIKTLLETGPGTCRPEIRAEEAG